LYRNRRIRDKYGFYDDDNNDGYDNDDDDDDDDEFDVFSSPGRRQRLTSNESLDGTLNTASPFGKSRGLRLPESLSKAVLAAQPADLDALMALAVNGAGDTIETVRQALVAKIGENIKIRRFALMTTEEGVIGSYRHGDRIGTMIKLTGKDIALAKDLAMHVAANRPQAISAADLPAELLEKERDIVATQAKDSGKPEAIVEKMVAGRMSKFVNEISLMGQPFVKDPDVTVEKLVKKANASVEAFEFFEVGDGIEKAVDNFAEEVMAQVKGN